MAVKIRAVRSVANIAVASGGYIRERASPRYSNRKIGVPALHQHHTPGRRNTQAARDSDPVKLVVDRLISAGCSPKAAGRKSWRSRCPAHRDKRASLKVSRGTDGKALLKCFGGCRVEEITAKLGLGVASLFPEAPATSRRMARSRETFASLDQAVARFAELYGATVQIGPWVYQHADGTDAFAIARFELPDGDKEYRPFKPTKAGWRLGMIAGKRPLYRLPDLAEADRIVIVEGEKCVEAAERIGLIATTTAFGADSPGRTDLKPLEGKRIVIVPDNDEAGEEYAAELAKRIGRLRPRANVTILRLPELPRRGDIADWLRHGVPERVGPEETLELFESLAAEASAAARPPLRVVSPPTPPPPRPAAPDEEDLFDFVRCGLWLRRRLESGPVATRTIEYEATSLGYSRTTLHKAKQFIGARSERIPLRKGYQIVLPIQERELSQKHHSSSLLARLVQFFANLIVTMGCGASVRMATKITTYCPSKDCVINDPRCGPDWLKTAQVELREASCCDVPCAAEFIANSSRILSKDR